MKTFICEMCYTEVPQHTPMVIPHCPECGNVTFMSEKIIPVEKSTREQALEWWKNFSNTEKYNLSKEYLKFHGGYSARSFHSLTGREIEELWRKRTQQTYDEMKSDSDEMYKQRLVKEFENDLKSQVDFEMLNESIVALRLNEEGVNYAIQEQEYIDNINLFFKLLATKPTFAKVAHKELNKLI